MQHLCETSDNRIEIDPSGLLPMTFEALPLEERRDIDNAYLLDGAASKALKSAPPSVAIDELVATLSAVHRAYCAFDAMVRLFGDPAARRAAYCETVVSMRQQAETMADIDTPARLFLHAWNDFRDIKAARFREECRRLLTGVA